MDIYFNQPLNNLLNGEQQDCPGIIFSEIVLYIFACFTHSHVLGG